MAKLKFTKATVESLPYATSGQVHYRDITLVGFGVCVGRDRQEPTYAEKRVAGRPVRGKIGRHDQLNCEDARRMALSVLGEMSSGANPNALRKEARQRRDFDAGVSILGAGGRPGRPDSASGAPWRNLERALGPRCGLGFEVAGVLAGRALLRRRRSSGDRRARTA